MLYRKRCSIRFGEKVASLSPEIRLLVRGGEFVLTAPDDTLDAEASFTMPVDPENLAIRKSEPGIDGSPGEEGIDMPERDAVRSIVQSIERILSFVLEVPVHAASMLGRDELIPESSSDEQRLRELGNLHPFVGLRTNISIRAPALTDLDDRTVDRLLEREVGLAIFADALSISRPIGKYRELWRVLESAFGLKGGRLIEALAQFAPASELGFDREELRAILVLRGRASHAESSAGLEEYETVTRTVEAKLPRLRTLVFQVLLTKGSWGSRGNGVDRLARLWTYVNKEGTPVVVTTRASTSVQ